MRVLLVEDDWMIAETIQTYLQSEGYAVEYLRDGRTAAELLEREPVDLLLLDLGLPDGDGLEILIGMRRAGSAIPVLILSARETVDDRVRGLDLGADDYLVKPFCLSELGARVRCALRRRGGRAQTAIELLGVSIDPGTRQVCLDGAPVALSEREFAVLEALAQQPGAVLSRVQLEERLYGWGGGVESNPVAVHIHAIRQKLGQDFIRNLRGVGYFIPAPDAGS